MASDFKLNYAGVGELLKSADMARVCEEQAKRLAASKSRDYFTETKTGSSRVRSEIKSDSWATRTHNKKSNDWSGY